MDDAAVLFKGIALFTPGGDLAYCLDPTKQGRWHANLCKAIQEALQLSEPPYFLLPCYSATVDRWRDPSNSSIQTSASLTPFLDRHRLLLESLFNLTDLDWELPPCPEELCHPVLLDRYREQFPALWEHHDLVIEVPVEEALRDTSNYAFQLFVSGYTGTTHRILKIMHSALEEALDRPYVLDVIDILTNPEAAEQAQIKATPTLIKLSPSPVQRLVGEMKSAEDVLQLLGIVH
jgi:circadian clock protein KaiB